MIDTIVGILLILTFLGFIVFVMKGGNIMLGFLVMAILWTIIGGIPLKTAIVEVFSKPALEYGSTIMVIIFGSWFGRVLVDTGVAGAISNEAVKVSYKHPIIASILICLVTSLIFTSSYGVGAVIALAVILIPVLISLGLPKHIAVVAFSLSIGSAMYVNIVIIKQLQIFFPHVFYGAKYLKFGFSAMFIQLAVVTLFILLHARTIHKNESEKSDHQLTSTVRVPKISYIMPVFPVFMNLAFGWEPIPALMLSIAIVLLITGNLKSYNHALIIINDSIKTAITDISGLIIMLLFLTMFSATAVKNAAKFSDILNSIVPNSPTILAISIVILAPLALFRGPLMVWGAGSATVAVLAGTGIFNQYFAFALMLIPSVSIAISTCITQSWNLWLVEDSKIPVKKFLLTGVPYGWISAGLNVALALYMFK